MLNGADIFLSDSIPFFFQTGYLTIKNYNPEFNQYILGFPNREVTEGFNELVLKCWMRTNEPAMFVSDFVEEVREGNAEAFMDKIKYFFAVFRTTMPKRTNVARKAKKMVFAAQWRYIIKM